MKTVSEKTKGIALILCAGFCFSAMSVTVKLAGDVPTFEKAFFRNLVAAFIAFWMMKRKGVGFSVPKEARPFLLLRVTAGTIGIVGNFYAIMKIGLADSNMLQKLSPFFAVLFSVFILNEKIKPVQLLTLVGAFLGALCIIRPSGANLSVIPGLVGFMGGMGAGLAYACVRRCTNAGTKGPVIVLCFSLFSCIVCGLLAIPGFVMPSPAQWVPLLLCGVCGAGGQFFITAAYSHAPAREISVFDYTQVIFSALMGFLLFRQIPDLWSLLGYAAITSMAIINYVNQ